MNDLFNIFGEVSNINNPREYGTNFLTNFQNQLNTMSYDYMVISKNNIEVSDDFYVIQLIGENPINYLVPKIIDD